MVIINAQRLLPNVMEKGALTLDKMLVLIKLAFYVL